MEKYFLRPPTLQDRQAVFDLMIRCDIRDVGFPDSDIEDLDYDWNHIAPTLDAWLAFDGRGELRGYGAVLGWGEGRRLVIYDDPGTEQSDLFLGLLMLCEKRATSILIDLDDPQKTGIYTHVADNATYQKTVLEEAGYRIQKFIFNMHADLDRELLYVQVPEGILLRTAHTGEDDHAIHALVQEAFNWRERHPQPFDEWQQFMMRPDVYDSSLWFLAEKEGELIGTCLCTAYSDIGWIRQLAVKKPYRKQGIGRALLVHAFQAFRERGYTKAGLSVESENSRAYQFYEKAGMIRSVQLDEYVKTIQVPFTQKDDAS